MPIYEFQCNCVKDDENRASRFKVNRPSSQAHLAFICPNCLKNATRVYTFFKSSEFVPYTDGEKHVHIGSKEDEKRHMKKNKLVYTDETPAYDKFKGQRKKALAKPIIYSKSAVTKMERD